MITKERQPSSFVKIVDFICVIVLTFAVVIPAASGVFAAAEPYSLTWDASPSSLVFNDNAGHKRNMNFRNMRLARANDDSKHTEWVCIGPAEWQVKSTSLIGGKSFTERWSAVSWNDVGMTWDPSVNISYDYITTPNCLNPGGLNSPSGVLIDSNGNGTTWGIKPDGLYGAMILGTAAHVNVYKAEWQAAASWPTKWEIKGCVYDGAEDQCPYYTR